MKLPQFPTAVDALSLLQTKWASILDPIISLPVNNSMVITNVILSSSAVINHKLGRAPVGWHIIRQRGNATVYDRQDTNLTPATTLLLSASSGVKVDILVF